MTSRSIACLGVFALIPVTGCVAGGGDDDPFIAGEEITEAEQEIKGGYNAPADTATVGVVSLAGGGFGMCSGSLIAPNMVLTARHCVSNTQNQIQGGVVCGVTSFGPPYAANNLYITSKPYFTQNLADYHAVREVRLLPTESNLFCGADQAILILNDNVDPAEAVPYVPRVDDSLVVGEGYFAVGFGAIDDNGNGSGARRRRDNLFVECVGSGCGQNSSTDTEWVGDTGICSGDSGGPAVDLQNRVVGVTSRGSQGCDHPVYGHVFGWGEWIKENGLYAAQLGGYEPPAWALGAPTHPKYNYPVGGACGAPEQCESGYCQSGYCTRECTELAPCPEGYQCGPNGVCDLIPPPPPPAEQAGDSGGDNASGDESGGGCSLSGDADPTNPIPWGTTGGAALALMALVARRRKR